MHQPEGVNALLRFRTLLIASIIAALFVGSLLLWAWLRYGHAVTLDNISTARTAVYTFLGTIPALWYFFALVILPAAGAPLTLFYLTALPVLGVNNTLLGLALVWLALLLNMVLAHVVSRGVFHPLISWTIRHRGLTIPKIQPANEWQIVLAIRLSPIPFALQNYVLALGHARWRTYLWTSLPIQAGIGTAVMLLGESILSGGLGFILLALCLLIVLQLVAKRLRASLLHRKAHARS